MSNLMRFITSEWRSSRVMLGVKSRGCLLAARPLHEVVLGSGTGSILSVTAVVNSSTVYVWQIFLDSFMLSPFIGLAHVQVRAL